MALLMDLAIVFAAANTILLSGLVYYYARIFRKSKAVYAAGLVIFALALLLQNGMTVFAYFTMTSLFAEGVLPYLFAISTLELVSVLAVFRVTII